MRLCQDLGHVLLPSFKQLTSRSKENTFEGETALISNNECQEFVNNTILCLFVRGGGAGVDCVCVEAVEWGEQSVPVN